MHVQYVNKHTQFLTQYDDVRKVKLPVDLMFGQYQKENLSSDYVVKLQQIFYQVHT